MCEICETRGWIGTCPYAAPDYDGAVESGRRLARALSHLNEGKAMSVRAKFTCTAVTKYPSGSKIEMSAVYSSTGENADFAESTPSGTFSMMISEGKPAASAFTPGKAYYLDFSEAQAVEALVSPSLEAPPAPSNPTPAEPDAWAVLDKDGDVWSAWAERDVCQNEIRRKEHPQKYAPYTVQPLYLARAGSSAPTEGKP